MPIVTSFHSMGHCNPIYICFMQSNFSFCCFLLHAVDTVNAKTKMAEVLGQITLLFA